MVYEGIITAIKKYQKKVNVELSVKFSCLDTKVWTIIQRGNKAVQTALDKSEAVPAAVNKWNKIYNSPLNWKKDLYQNEKNHTGYTAEMVSVENTTSHPANK